MTNTTQKTGLKNGWCAIFSAGVGKCWDRFKSKTARFWRRAEGKGILQSFYTRNIKGTQN